MLRFPRVISTPEIFTGIGVSNPTPTEVSVTFTAFHADGSMVTGPGLRNPVTLTIPTGGQIAKQFPEIFGSTTFNGWVQASSATSGLAGFFLNGNPALSDLDGAASVAPESDFVLPLAAEDNTVRTELTLVNPNADPASATATLYATDGRVLSTKVLNIPGRGLVRQTLRDVFTGADLSAASHIEVGSNLPLLGHELVADFQLPATSLRRETVAISARRPTAEQRYVLPQFATGGGWLSLVGVVNTAGIRQDLTFTAYKDDGTVWEASSNPKTIPLEAHGGLRTTADALFGFSPGSGRTGWIEIRAPIGFLDSYVGFGNGATPSFAIARGTSTASAAKTMVFAQVAEGAGFYTGLTVMNPGTQPASLDFFTLRDDGTTVGRSSFTLGPGQRRGRLFRELLPASLGQVGGWGLLRSSQPVAAAVLFGSVNGLALANVPPQISVADFVPPLQATATITGTVRQNGAAAADISIVLSGPVHATRNTDAEGRFIFGQLPPGQYRLVPTRAGAQFSPGERTITIARENTDVEFEAGGLTPALAPAVDFVTPASTFAGNRSLNVRVLGADFTPTSVVRINGTSIPTTFISSTELQGVVPATLLVQAALLDVIVETAPPGGGRSGRIDFTVNPVTTNPLIQGRANVGAFPAGVAIDESRQQGLITNQSDDSVTILDLTRLEAVASIRVGRSPAEGVGIHRGLDIALIANPGSNDLSVIDLKTRAILKTIAVGAFPSGLAIHQGMNRAVVANSEDDTVSIVSLDTLSVTTTIGVGLRPSGVAINPRTNVAVITNRGGNNASLIDLNTNIVVGTINVGQFPRGVAINAETNQAVVVNANDNTVSVIDLAARTVLGTIAVGTGPTSVAIHAITNSALVTNSGIVRGTTTFGGIATVSVIDLGRRAVTATIPVGSAAFGLDVDDVNQRAVVVNFGSNDVTIVRIPNPQPRVTDVQPKTFPAGATTFTITIQGTGFLPTSVVTLNGQPLPTTFVSSTELRAQVSATFFQMPQVRSSQTDSVKGGVYAQVQEFVFDIGVSNPGPGGGESPPPTDPISNRILLQNLVPVLVSVSPTHAEVGTGTFTLTLNGNNFNATSIVNFGSTQHSPSSVNDNSMTVVIPLAGFAVGVIPISVSNPAPGGGLSDSRFFEIDTPPNPAPAIDSVDPASVTAGSGAVTLTVRGTGFTAGTQATLGGVTANAVGNSITINVSDQMTRTAGTLSGLVATPGPGGGTASFSLNVLNPVPKITSFTPASSLAGSSSPLQLQITGQDFVPTTIITLQGTRIPTTFESATSVRGELSAAFAARSGQYVVGVVNPGPGGGSAFGGNLTIEAPKPEVSSVAPASALRQNSALTVQLHGKGFTANSQAIANGKRLTTVMDSPSILSITLTADLMQISNLLTITVENPSPGGGTSSPVTFTVVAGVPSISAISPVSVTAGQSVRVEGANFGVGTTVLINGATVPVTVLNENELTTTIPVSVALGSVSLVVRNPAPGGDSAPFLLNIGNPMPSLTGTDPAFIQAEQVGSRVTVNGQNFVPSSVVLLGGTAATTIFVNSEAVVFSVPYLTSLTSLEVQVFNPAPGGGTSNSLRVPVMGTQPSIASITPTSGRVGATLTLNLVGSGFVSTSEIEFNGTSISTSFGDSTSLTGHLVTPGPGAYNVKVKNPGGLVSNIMTFNVYDSPTLTSVSPIHVFLGSSQVVSLTGTNFVPGITTVTVSGTGISVTGVNVTSPTSATATFNIAAGTTLGPRNIQVTTTGGTSNAVALTVFGTPTLATVNPPAGAQGNGISVTLNGSQFAGATNVSVAGGGVTVSNVFVQSDTTLTATFTIAGNAAIGVRSVSVTTGGGTSNAQSFTVNPPFPIPVLRSVTPGQVDTVFATLPVTLTGDDFVTGATTVSVAGGAVIVSNVIVINSTTLTADFSFVGGLPSSTPNVTVTTAGGTSNSTPVSLYAVATAPLYLGASHGGGGGTPFTLDCPAGSVATGLEVRGGANVDQIQVRCQTVTGAARTFGGVTTTAPAGGFGGNAFTLACPAGYVMTGLTGRIGNGGSGLNDQIAAVCSAIAGGASTTTSSVGSNFGGSIGYTETCPAGLIMTGIQGGAGNLVDRTQIRCK